MVSKGTTSAVQVCIRVRPQGVNLGGEAEESTGEVVNVRDRQIMVDGTLLGPFSEVVTTKMS